MLETEFLLHRLAPVPASNKQIQTWIQAKYTHNTNTLAILHKLKSHTILPFHFSICLRIISSYILQHPVWIKSNQLYSYQLQNNYCYCSDGYVYPCDLLQTYINFILSSKLYYYIQSFYDIVTNF